MVKYFYEDETVKSIGKEDEEDRDKIGIKKK